MSIFSKLKIVLPASISKIIPSLGVAEGDRLRRTANELWIAGDKDKAMDVLSQAKTRYPQDSLISLSYASKLLQTGDMSAARDALLECLVLEPGNTRAYELLEEAQAVEKLSQKLKDDLTLGLLRSYSPDDEDSFLKLFFLAPKRTSMAAVKDFFDRDENFGSGPDLEVVRYMRLNSEERLRETSQLLGSPNLMPMAVCQIVLGANSAAIPLLKDYGVDEVPPALLRVAARRELRRRRSGMAAEYLRLFLKEVPNDRWAKTNLARLERSRGDRTGSNYHTGPFPFSGRAAERSYQPILNRGFYFLHNSLPYDSGGYATRSHGLLAALNRSGWDISGVTRYGYPYDRAGFDVQKTPVVGCQVDNVTYERFSKDVVLPVRKTPLLTFISRYADAAQELAIEKRPLILHGASNHWNGLAAAEVGRRLDIPVVYEVRGLWEVTRASREPGYSETEHYKQRAAIEAEACNAADRVLTITNALKFEMVKRGVPEEKISVVPNGVNTKRFKPLIRDEELEEQIGVNGRTVIGYVGSVVDYEGLEDLLDVVVRLAKKRSDFILLIVGDGAVWPRIKARVEAEGLEEVVKLTGRVPHEDVESYYSIIDICPFPRKPLPVCEMVSPLKPFEALAMGKSILSSNVDALKEIVQDGETGLLFEKGNIDSFEEKLTMVLDDEALRRRLSCNGLAWVRANRDWSILGERVGGIYESLGARRSGA
ncbi:glycosyltransferase family 4 protein [Corynebacterium sp. TAE3-ERU16]|uniref:glycosyltransferase family 4 protein n=1 Tax=Corynebacterium sp. TAE3-ERU16 TaxID=2849493 RepID=UPI001C484B32|nr:glycosyltransferase family 4 protein [Corynebacterium sp. TAE3-ERU16]MBV7294238.1 glycosyltransferase [Corynebacterium sp. TAE3-ERU16]